MLLHALIEEWPSRITVYVHELPGAVVTDSTLADALEALPDAIEAHLSWMASHGFDVWDYAGVNVEIAERLVAQQGRVAPRFEADRSIPTAAEVERALSIAALARRDLIDLYRSVSDFRRDRPPAPGEWSIADHLRHVAHSEAFYVAALVDGRIIPLPDHPVDAMRASAAHAEAVLRSLDEPDRSPVREYGGEQWTTTKVLRRLTGHLREHYPLVRALARG